jgi:hypothetical protein
MILIEYCIVRFIRIVEHYCIVVQKSLEQQHQHIQKIPLDITQHNSQVPFVFKAYDGAEVTFFSCSSMDPYRHRVALILQSLVLIRI